MDARLNHNTDLDQINRGIYLHGVCVCVLPVHECYESDSSNYIVIVYILPRIQIIQVLTPEYILTTGE